uniref:Uncharacterized protein n=1 Tax=Rousettus aegyptiacus TaxID=9407 RepID=A0A7J8ILD5_ROUAE|nr:hypothetical protein HJG63_010633 [Rousettus aegyptiacus]
MIQQCHIWVFSQRSEITVLRCLHPHVHCHIICNSQDMETSVYKQTDEDIVVFIMQWNIFAIKKGRNPATCDIWMDFEGIMLSEINQRQVPCDLTYMRILFKKTNKKQTNKQKQADSYRDQTSSC